MCERKTKKKKTNKTKKRKPTFEWRGCLIELRDKYSSIDLQHRALSTHFEFRDQTQPLNSSENGLQHTIALLNAFRF